VRPPWQGLHFRLLFPGLLRGAGGCGASREGGPQRLGGWVDAGLRAVFLCALSRCCRHRHSLEALRADRGRVAVAEAVAGQDLALLHVGGVLNPKLGWSHATKWGRRGREGTAVRRLRGRQPEKRSFSFHPVPPPLLLLLLLLPALEAAGPPTGHPPCWCRGRRGCGPCSTRPTPSRPGTTRLRRRGCTLCRRRRRSRTCCWWCRSLQGMVWRGGVKGCDVGGSCEMGRAQMSPPGSRATGTARGERLAWAQRSEPTLLATKACVPPPPINRGLRRSPGAQ
jgi:hypothetical protein